MKDIVSVVPPDLLETINNVFLRSKLSRIFLTDKGCVLSNTFNAGKPFFFPNVLKKTSGARLLPPIPRSTILLKSFLTSSAKSFNSFILSCIKEGRFNHPRRFDNSTFSSGFCFQRVGSIFHNLIQTVFFSTTVNGFQLLIEYDHWQKSPALYFACPTFFLFSIVDIKSRKECAKDSTPSTVSFFVISEKSILRSFKAFICLRASSTLSSMAL